MNKVFSVHCIYRQEISPGKGSVIWLLSDEKGLPRKVCAVADLDENGVVQDVHAVYSREIPLVEVLRQHDKGDVFSIDFSGFNQQNGYALREAYQRVRERENARRIPEKIIRALALLGMLAVLLFLYFVLTDVGELTLNFPRHLNK